MTDDRLKTESAGRPWLKRGAAGKSPGLDCREEVYACRRSLAEPRAARFAGIAAFSSLLPKEAWLRRICKRDQGVHSAAQQAPLLAHLGEKKVAPDSTPLPLQPP